MCHIRCPKTDYINKTFNTITLSGSSYLYAKTHSRTNNTIWMYKIWLIYENITSFYEIYSSHTRFLPAVPLTISSYMNYCTFLRIVGALSSWMREHGYYLARHTRKEKLPVPTVEDCWKACLQETEFECLSIAYAAVSNQTCRLYDKKALSVYRDWTNSDEFSYYEYCANGGWHNLTHIYFSVR